MKISNREKYLLGILIAVLIILGYYQLVYLNQTSRLDKLRNEKAEIEQKYNTIMTTVNQLDSKQESVKILTSKVVDKSKNLYPDTVQEKLILEIDQLLKDSKVKANINFSDFTVKPIETKEGSKESKAENSLKSFVNQYKGIKTNNNDTNQSITKGNTDTTGKNEALNINQVKVTLNYKASYEALTDLIKKIEEHDKKIVLSSLTINGSGSELSGSLTLEFYGVPKIDSKDEDYLKWTLSNQYGKSNPYNGNSTGNVSKSQSTSDFILSARSFDSDLATVTLRYAKDSSLKSSVYADNEGNEDVEINVIKESGKYYYRFKTSKESYPKNYSDKIEFTPSGDNINIQILSNIRTGTGDKSGVNLNVINNTDRTVNVTIKGDDAVTPRVYVKSEGTSVNTVNIK
jgi:type IV pilus assembly protein PilO